MYASARLRMKKSVASAAVARERKLAEPVAPKRLLEAPPPKPEPMSAPLPCWSSTRPMMPSATITWATMMMLVQKGMCFSLCSGCRGSLVNGHELLRYERRPADQPAIDVGHRKNRGRVLRLHAAAVQDPHLVSGFFS